MYCNMLVVEIFGSNEYFLWMANVWGGEIVFDVIFYKESFDVSKSVGCWLLGVLTICMTSPDLHQT